MHHKNAGESEHAAGEREISVKCGSLPRDAGDLAGLALGFGLGLGPGGSVEASLHA